MNTAHLRSRADLILFGGRVITLDGAANVAEAVAVDGERIAYLTFEEDVKGTVSWCSPMIR